jgi:hypothetical protein
MSITNKELIESALKRVNALAGTNGKLYRDNTGWYVIWKGASHLSESAMSAGELIAYLHGIEDGLNYRKTQLEDIQRKADEELQKEHDNIYRKVDRVIDDANFVNWED